MLIESSLPLVLTSDISLLGVAATYRDLRCILFSYSIPRIIYFCRAESVLTWYFDISYPE
jgi:hypothetical protein